MEKEVYGYIYCITNLVNNKKYIGQTSRTIEQRKLEHIRHRNSLDFPLYRAFRKYGLENFIWESLDIGLDQEDLNKKEIYYIEYFNTYKQKKGYNDVPGGRGGAGFLGKKHSEQTKKQMSESQKKREKVVITDSWRKAIGDSKRGLNSPRKRKVKNLDTGEEFEAIVFASIKYNISCCYISACCRGRRKKAKGYHWAYID